MQSSEINRIVEQLDPLLLEGDRLKLLPSSFYQQILPEKLRVWCRAKARYTLPTIELIEFLKQQIGERSAIELGAGNGDLGFHLGIAQTDSYCQDTPMMKLYYQSIGQTVTQPREDVERLEALDGIAHHKPQVAIASWLTQIYRPDCDLGSEFGADEEQIIAQVEMYIHVGNRDSHGSKRILKKTHIEYVIPGLVTRANRPEENVIYVWHTQQ